MVHHAAPEEVVAAIAAVGERRQARTATRSAAMRQQCVRRRWLHIGDDCQERERITAAATNSGEQAFSRQTSSAFIH
jgi:hypothetical protein